jgi:hypothetical protein
LESSLGWFTGFEPAPCGTVTPPAVGQALKAHGASARAELERFLSAQPEAPYLSALVADYPRRPGKMMRAGLCMAAAGLFGPRPPEAVRTAAAIELFHNGLLIHDEDTFAEMKDYISDEKGGFCNGEGSLFDDRVMALGITLATHYIDPPVPAA